MQVRHNTALLEQAVDLIVKQAAIPTLQAEADARERAARAASFRRLATGGAVAIAAVGIGLGAYLGFWNFREPAKEAAVTQSDQKLDTRLEPEPDAVASADAKTPERNVPVPSARPATVSGSEPEQPNAITVDFTKFVTTTTHLNGREWRLEAGHYYKDENDTSWEHAWCYTRQRVGGVEVNITLVNRSSPTAQPLAPVAPLQTLEAVGLNDENAVALAARCAWLDERQFAANEFLGDPSRPVVEATVESSIAEPEFLIRDGWDAIGHDLPGMPIRGVSIEWCNSACEANSQCLAMTYNKPAKACFLKGDASIVVANKQATMAARSVVEANLTFSDLVFQPKTRVSGASYGNQTQISYPDCIILCAGTQACRGFNYYRKTASCEFFSSVVASSDNSDVLAGMKQAN